MENPEKVNQAQGKLSSKVKWNNIFLINLINQFAEVLYFLIVLLQGGNTEKWNVLVQNMVSVITILKPVKIQIAT